MRQRVPTYRIVSVPSKPSLSALAFRQLSTFSLCNVMIKIHIGGKRDRERTRNDDKSNNTAREDTTYKLLFRLC